VLFGLRSANVRANSFGALFAGSERFVGETDLPRFSAIDLPPGKDQSAACFGPTTASQPRTGYGWEAAEFDLRETPAPRAVK